MFPFLLDNGKEMSKVTDIVSDWTGAYGIGDIKDAMWDDYNDAIYFIANPQNQIKAFPNYLTFIMHPNQPDIQPNRRLILGVGADKKFRKLSSDFTMTKCRRNGWLEATFADVVLSGNIELSDEVNMVEIEINALNPASTAKSLAKFITKVGDPVVYVRDGKWQLTIDGNWWIKFQGEDRAILCNRYATQQQMDALKIVLEWLF